jgi:glycosyltransferase involved in cell wall biosynthesis
MKVLYIYNFYQQSGGENLWFDSEPNLLRSHGHSVVVYKRDNRELEQYSTWQKASLLWQASWSQRSYDDVLNIIRLERPDVAHVYNTLALVTPSVYYACQQAQVPVVQTLYNYRLLCPDGSLTRNERICEECVDHSLWRAVRHACYRDSRVQSAAVAWMVYSHARRGTWGSVIDAYLVPTEFMRRKLSNRIPAQKLFVKPNWHEPDPGMRQHNDGFALFIGRLTVEKGLRTLLKAWSVLSNPPLLRIIGDGPLRREVESMVKDRADGRIEVLGPLPHSDVVEQLKCAAFLVLPSEWYEGFPHVILEAYACGVPIIASRIGTLADVIRHEETGLLHDPGDHNDLAAKVCWLGRHAEEAAKMGLVARAEYETKYTGKRNYQLLMEIYTKVLANRGFAKAAQTVDSDRLNRNSSHGVASIAYKA